MLVPKTYPLLVQAIEDGIRMGYGRAHKHSDSPDEYQLLECLVDSTILAVMDRFDIDDVSAS